MKLLQQIKAFVFQGRYPCKKADLCKDDIYRPKSKVEDCLRMDAPYGVCGKGETTRFKSGNGDQREEAMRRAIAITFERSLKSDHYLQAAQRGRDDFFFLLDGNNAMIAESVLGMYQRILNEIVDVDSGFQ